jgi:threonine/homoserine/homoserine lactone efflux protein
VQTIALQTLAKPIALPGQSMFPLASWFEGVLYGLAIAAPVGPIALLCIRNALQGGWQLGLISGLGVATADATYGAIAAFGLAALSRILLEQQVLLQLLGGGFLIWLGFQQWRATPSRETEPVVMGPSPWRTYSTTFLLTLTNPQTILAFTALLASRGLQQTGQLSSALALVVGVFCGSALWWLLLSFTVMRLGHRLGPQTQHRLNQIGGAVILGFGLMALAQGLRPR